VLLDIYQTCGGWQTVTTLIVKTRYLISTHPATEVKALSYKPVAIVYRIHGTTANGN